jgi:hypothetical protein
MIAAQPRKRSEMVAISKQNVVTFGLTIIPPGNWCCGYING